MSNKAFLSSSIKKLPKECAVTSFGQQGGLQKVGFNRLGYMVGLGQVRLTYPKKNDRRRSKSSPEIHTKVARKDEKKFWVLVPLRTLA